MLNVRPLHFIKRLLVYQLNNKKRLKKRQKAERKREENTLKMIKSFAAAAHNNF